MKGNFRSIALALAGLAGVAMGVIADAIRPVLRYIAIGCEALASGLEKLNRELVHKVAEDVKFASGANSGLQRESNGFRQSSASKAEWLDPAMG